MRTRISGVRSRSGAFIVILLTGTAGCASLPTEQGYQEASGLVQARLGMAPVYSSHEANTLTPADMPTTAIDPVQAVKLAFLYSPRVAQAYVRIGLSRADLEAARRLANPGFGYSRLDSSRGGEQVGRSLTLSLTDLVLRPVRQRFAAAALEQMQSEVASELQAIATDVEIGWYGAVAAAQIADTRALTAEASRQSALLARRFFEAGNINRLQLAQEQAAAATASIESTRAQAVALRARTDLATLIGLSVESPWTTTQLPELPPDTTDDPEGLALLAVEQRLDLASARQQLAWREDALAMTQRWRWLGRLEVGYERESEAEGGVIRGPTFAVELPIFNQGQDVIARAQAQLQEARLRLDYLTLQVRNDVHAAAEGMQFARDVAERYRAEVVPARETVVARTQEEVNYMLKGAFELIVAKQAEYDAWQGYIESVRDYWIQRAHLRAAVGGQLPGERNAFNSIAPHSGQEPGHHEPGETQ